MTRGGGEECRWDGRVVGRTDARLVTHFDADAETQKPKRRRGMKCRARLNVAKEAKEAATD